MTTSARAGIAAAVASAALVAAACVRESPPDPRIDSAFVHAESTYWRGEPDSAEIELNALLRSAEARGDATTAGRAVTALAVVAYRNSDYDALQRLGAQALTMPLRPADRFRANNILGLGAYYQSRYQDAAPFFDRAIEEARRNGDSLDAAKSTMNRGLVDVELGEYARARDRFVATLLTTRSLDPRTAGKALANLGMLDTKVGDPVAAIARLDSARTIYRAIDYGPGEVNALGQLGVAYGAMGEPQRALAALDSSIIAAREQGLAQEEASGLQLIAEQYQAAGDLSRALDYLARAQVLNAKHGLRDEQGAALRNAAEIHFALGQHALASQRTVEALAVHAETGAALERLIDHLLLARIEDRAGRRVASDSVIRTARALADRLSTPDSRGRVALAVAEIADRGNRARDVLDALDSAAADLSLAAPAADVRVLTLRARAFARLGLLDSAVMVGRRAVRAVERVRGRYAAGPLRTSYVSGNTDTYADLVLVHLRQGRTSDAFEVADAARGRGLLEHLSQARGDLASRSGAGRDLVESQALLQRIESLMAQLRDRVGPRQRERALAADRDDTDLSAQLQRARNDYEALLERATRQDEAGAAVLGSRPVESAAVRSSLRTGEVLVEYFMTTDRLLAFAATRDTIRVVETRVGAVDLASRVRVARELVARRDVPAARTHSALESLHAILIDPLQRAGILDAATRIVIVPHGPLTYLPFAALRDARGSYLVERHAILYMPSAAALPALRGMPARPLDAAAAVAFAPFPQELPATEFEARGVSRAMPGAVMHAGASATEAALRRALAGSSLVHVATHGQLNPHSPMFSHVALAPGQRGARSDDGRLEVHELLGMHVRSALVFLSGCETGAGSAWSTAFSPGEDFTTLAQAFLYAGARTVVATLWRIEDDAAAAFAERFYEGLQTKSPPEALAEAQRALFRHPRYRAVFDWAAYEVSGGDEAVRVVAVRADVR